MGRAFRTARVMGMVGSDSRAERREQAQKKRYGRVRQEREEHIVETLVDTDGDGVANEAVTSTQIRQFVTQKAERDHVKLSGVDNLLQELGLADDQEAFFRR